VSTAPVIPIRRLPAAEAPLVWMTEHEVSEHLKVPVDTLRDWRRTGAVKTLPFHRLGRLVRYELGEIDAAMNAARVEVTR